MYQLNFKQPHKIHFIGIGGISMSGLAEILMQEGFRVSGSDSQSTVLTKHLQRLGAEIYLGQRASNIKDDVEVVVYTAAIHEDNEELMEVRRRNIPVLSRAELLGQMMRNYKHAVAVSGTHGKTTTTSMLAQILLEGDMDPTISVGGILNTIGGNIRVGKSQLFVTEACEYTNSFLSFYPSIAVILNIREDHMDFFKDLNEIRQSFHNFAGRLTSEGILIMNTEIDNYQEIAEGLPNQLVTFGTKPESDYRGCNISYDSQGRASFDLIIRGVDMGNVKLTVPGEHNVSNALAAVAAASELSVPFEEIKEGLSKFTGTNRRFEKKGEVKGVTIIDDYAHHPDEISATLQAAKNVPHRRLWCVFQPHTYTRTKAFMEEFVHSLSIADEVILADIYAAREIDTLGVSSQQLKEKIVETGTPAHYFSTFDEITDFITKNCKKDDLLITMGAGDIVKVGESLLKV